MHPNMLLDPRVQAGMSFHRPDYWAEQNRLIYGKPFTIIPPVRDLYRDRWPKVVVRKAAQVFVSEWLINMALWCADTLQGERGKALYVFPKERQLEDFAKDRIAKALGESPTLSLRSSGDVHLKHIGPGVIYFRGSTNRAQMISVDADLILCDEVAEFPSGTIDIFERRLSSSLLGWVRAGSTPRYPADELGVLWDQSDQRFYQVQCHHCNQWQPLDVETHLDAEQGKVLCEHCHQDMGQDRLSEGHWDASRPGSPWHGYHLSKLFSPRASLKDLANKYLAVLEGRADMTQTQEFWNSDAGKAYLPEGGHLTSADLDACQVAGYVLPLRAEHCVMGIDVGARLHVRIDQPVEGGTTRLVYAGAVKYWGESEAAAANDPQAPNLDTIMARYDVDRCVIDANPETTKAREFASRWKGRVWLCYFVQMESNAPEPVIWKREERKVQASRTAVLDLALARVLQRRIAYPEQARMLGGAVDTAGLGEFYRHALSPVRVLVKNAQDIEVARYAQNGPDHLFFADTYCLIASMRSAFGVPDWPEEYDPTPHDLRTMEDDLPLAPDHKLRKADPDQLAEGNLEVLSVRDRLRPSARPEPEPDFTDATLA